MRPSHLAAVALTAAACLAELSAQSTLQFTPDRDATLYEDAAGALANGGGTAMFVGMTGQPMARRGVVHFDLSAIPTGARVIGVSLTVNSTQSSSAAAMAMTGHRLLQDWSEGTTVATGGQGGGGPAQAGDVTWLHRDLPTLLWTAPGGDFVATPSFAMSVQAVGLSSSGYQPGMLADVQTWVSNPAANFGWLLKGDETLAGTASKLTTRETGGGVQLGVSFVLPGQVGQWGMGCTGGLPMQLNPSGSATGGATVGLGYAQAPASSVGASFYSLAIEYGPAGLGLPVSVDCVSYLPLNAIVPGNLYLTSAGGTANDSFVVPLNAPGFLVVCQGAVVDGSVLGVRLSNAAIMLTQ